MRTMGEAGSRAVPVTRDDVATLGNGDGYTIFEFRGSRIRFAAPYSLERYVDVRRWDDGYLVINAKYSHNAGVEEEYIDLIPILRDLYIDPVAFCKPIKSVEVAHA